MAQQNTGGFGVAHPEPYSPVEPDIKDPVDTNPKKTSIGNSNRSRPLNKHKRRQHKKYRGQGK